ncbi:MAG: peptide MFS transporter [Hyphomicrobium sp.]|nr:peptide MFS transporter [Hyphomicrobium sp.]
MNPITPHAPRRTPFLAGHARGLAPLFFTELWERFSYYGMRALLTLFMVAPIASGGLGFETQDAGRIYGNYTMAVYMLAIPGGFLADRILGARRAVLLGGWTIALGHYALAVPSIETFYPGLLLVALGTGLFKPNISALVGALYAPGDTRRDAGFSIFYMGINIGAFIAPLVTGFLAQSVWFKGWLSSNGFDPAHSWHWGFAAAGIGMTLAMLTFARNAAGLAEPHSGDDTEARDTPALIKHGAAVIGGTLALLALALASDQPDFAWLRWLFLALPIAGIIYAARQPHDDAQRLAAIGVLFIAAMIFWAIFEQAGTTIALFADRLTRNEIAGVPFPSAWFQSINPIFVILLAPMFAALWIALGARQPSPAIKFAIGLLFLSASFLLMVPAATLAAAGKVSPLWLIGLFLLQTIGELLLSPVGLSTMTKLAPARMTGLVLGLWFLAAAFGNKLAGVLGGGFRSEDPAALASAFLTQAGLVAIAAGLLFAAAPWVKRLSGNTH